MRKAVGVGAMLALGGAPAVVVVAGGAFTAYLAGNREVEHEGLALDGDERNLNAQFCASEEGRLVDLIVKCAHKEFRPMRVNKGGSTAKNTVVEGSDIDIVVVLKDFNQARLKSYCDRARAALERDVGVVKLVMTRQTAHGIKIEVTTRPWIGSPESQAVDILFTGDPEDNQYGNDAHYYNCFYTKEQTRYVKEQKNKFQPVLHDTIKELKRGCHGEVSGYFIELVCIQECTEMAQRWKWRSVTAKTVVEHQVKSGILFRGVRQLTCPITGSQVPHKPISEQKARLLIEAVN